MAKTSINARIQCVVQLPVGKWDGKQLDTDALLEQIKREGVEKLNHALKSHGGVVYGEPKVIFMVLEEEK